MRGRDMLMMAAEVIGLLLVAGTLLGPVFWLVLGLVTFAANTRSENLARAAAADADAAAVAATAPRVTRFARPAKLVAFGVVGSALLGVAEILLPLSIDPSGSWGAVLTYASIGLYAVGFVLTAVLAVILVAVWCDVRFRHRLAGRDAGVAYGTIALLHALMLGTYVVLAATNTHML